VWKQLGLKEGMRVLDCGCGYGDWLYWLKNTKNCEVQPPAKIITSVFASELLWWLDISLSRIIMCLPATIIVQVMGINMTKNHAEVVEGRGIKCLHTDWQSLFRDEARFAPLRNQFDCVTFYDTIEHYRKVSETCIMRGSLGQWINRKLGFEAIKLSGDITGVEYKELFAFAEAMIDPKSSCRAIWSSTLHLVSRWFELAKHGSYFPFPCFEYVMMVSDVKGVKRFHSTLPLCACNGPCCSSSCRISPAHPTLSPTQISIYDGVSLLLLPAYQCCRQAGCWHCTASSMPLSYSDIAQLAACHCPTLTLHSQQHAIVLL